MSKSDTQLLSVGHFFVEKNRQCCNAISTSTEAVMKADLFDNLETLFKSFSSLTLTRQISSDIIDIVNYGDGIRADVICVFCPASDVLTELKKYALQYDARSNEKSHYWNTSSFRRHVRSHVTQFLELNSTSTEMDQEPALDIAREQYVINDSSLCLSHQNTDDKSAHANYSCIEQSILL